jgi:hypothetical protein
MTHADEPIAGRAAASTFGEMQAENVIYGVIPDGTAIWALDRPACGPDLGELRDIS